MRTASSRVASETAIQQKRVSIPSVAVADFAKSVFERFDDKHVLVIGAGDMGFSPIWITHDPHAHRTSAQKTYDVDDPKYASKIGESLSRGSTSIRAISK